MKYRASLMVTFFLLCLLTHIPATMANNKPPLPPVPPSLPLPPPFPPLSIIVNGQKLNMDQGPLLTTGEILIPLRVTMEALGAEVVWDSDAETAMVHRENAELKLSPGKGHAIYNNKVIPLEVPLKLEGGRLLVPSKTLSETLGIHITWFKDNNIIIIN